jgi:hypothetical protein
VPTRTSWLVLLSCIGVALGLAGPTILFCGGGLFAGSCQWSFNHHGTTGDWRYFAESWEAARVALVDFHQLPSWNPYHCGGLVLYQDPQAPFPGLMFLLTFWWLPTGAAIKVWIITHLLVGTLGARALIKDRGGNEAEQILGAVLMAACGFVAWHTGGGHLSFTPFLFFPLALWAFRRSLRDARWAVLVAALFAVAFYEGATYPIPLMLVGLAIESVARLGQARDRRALFPALSIFGLLFPLLSALRLIPVLRYLREHPRLVPLDDQITLAEVFKAWLTPMHERLHAGHPYVWDEYADYVGLVPVAIMLVGVAIALVRRDEESRQRRIDLALLVVLIWCALGNIPGVSLFGLLHELPIYSSLRVPSRFLGPAMVGFALVVVSALMTARRLAVEQGLRPRFVRLLLGFELSLVVAVAINVCVVNGDRIQQGLAPALPRTRASADFYQLAGADYTQFPTFPVRAIGTRQCYVPMEWKPAPGIQDGKVAQQRIEPPAAGEVTLRRWSPNAIQLDVKLRAPGVVVINQNYESNWRSNLGAVGAFLVGEHRQWTRPPGHGDDDKPPVGLLSIALPAGNYSLLVRHRPPGLIAGLVLVILGLGFAVAVSKRLTPQWVALLYARLGYRLFAPRAPPSQAKPGPDQA